MLTSFMILAAVCIVFFLVVRIPTAKQRAAREEARKNGTVPSKKRK